MATDGAPSVAKSVPLESLEAAMQSIFALQNIEISVDEQRSLAKTLMRLAPEHLAGATDK